MTCLHKKPAQGVKNRCLRGLLLFSFAALALAGCAMGPNYRRPRVSAPAAFRGQAAPEKASLADLSWWDLYSDPNLQALIKEALADNNDMRAEVARVEFAGAMSELARSAYFPFIGYEGGVEKARNVFKLNPADLALPNENRSSGLFLGGLTAAWEFDVWGRIRRMNESALADYLGTEEAHRALMLSLTSSVAQAYFELQELDRRLEIAKTSVKAFDDTAKLFTRRFNAGIASKLEVARAESALAVARGSVDDIKRLMALKENEISVLVGKNPEAIKRSAPEKIGPEGLPAIPAGLPSTLLERRPDVRAAEETLVAANARIGMAKADFFPRIGLTAVYGAVSTELSTFTNGTSAVSALAAEFAGPIFTGGALTAQYKAALADYDQAKYGYFQTVITAFKEVSDALVSIQKLAQLEKEQSKSVDSLTESVTIVNKRYREGVSSYYEVLEAQQLLFPAEISLSKTRRDRLLAVVQLYKALGGGWKQSDAEWTKGKP